MNVTTDRRGVSVGGDQVTLMVGATSASRPQTTCATDGVVIKIQQYSFPVRQQAVVKGLCHWNALVRSNARVLRLFPPPMFVKNSHHESLV